MHTIDLAAMVAQLARLERLTQAATARRSAGATRSSLAGSLRTAQARLNRRAQRQ